MLIWRLYRTTRSTDRWPSVSCLAVGGRWIAFFSWLVVQPWLHDRYFSVFLYPFFVRFVVVVYSLCPVHLFSLFLWIACFSAFQCKLSSLLYLFLSLILLAVCVLSVIFHCSRPLFVSLGNSVMWKNILFVSSMQSIDSPTSLIFIVFLCLVLALPLLLITQQ